MSEIPAHVRRMLEERDQLQERLNKLTAFVETESAKVLGDDDRELLDQQAHQMKGYLTILNCRLGRAFVAKGSDR